MRSCQVREILLTEGYDRRFKNEVKNFEEILIVRLEKGRMVQYYRTIKVRQFL